MSIVIMLMRGWAIFVGGGMIVIGDSKKEKLLGLVVLAVSSLLFPTPYESKENK